MDFYDSNCQDFLETVRSTEAYMIFYQGMPIDHGKHASGPVSQSSVKKMITMKHVLEEWLHQISGC